MTLPSELSLLPEELRMADDDDASPERELLESVLRRDD
jgi:hypothetical protein